MNIYEKGIESQKKTSSSFFKECELSDKGLQALNTSMWNNQAVHEITGYSIDDIRQCLYEISHFICNNLQPNRLECFDIERILTTPIYNQQQVSGTQ